MTNHTAAPQSSEAADPALRALATAADQVVETFTGDIPFGAEAEQLARFNAAYAQLDKVKAAMLAPLAQMESSGVLLEEGGQKTVKAYLTHAWGIHSGEAKRLAHLAQGLHNEALPETAAALDEGIVSVGEASAIATCAEREVDKRDGHRFPDAQVYRSVIDTGLAGAKRARAAMSVEALNRTAHALGVELNPERVEQGDAAAFAARGARLRRTFAGSFLFEAWGPDAGAEHLQAALVSFTTPYEAHEPVARYARTYDALLACTGFAHGHHGCAETPGVKAFINVTVPLPALLAANTNTDGDGDGDGEGDTHTSSGAGVAPSAPTVPQARVQPPPVAAAPEPALALVLARR